MCQRVNKKLTTKTPELHPIPVKSPWFHVGIDFMGPINPTSVQGNRYILTISDYFSKFVDAVPLPDKSAAGVVKSLNKVQFINFLVKFFFQVYFITIANKYIIHIQG